MFPPDTFRCPLTPFFYKNIFLRVPRHVFKSSIDQKDNFGLFDWLVVVVVDFVIFSPSLKTAKTA